MFFYKFSALNSNDSTTTPTSEFNFLLNSIWSYVVECIDLNLNQIFSPVDPIFFHKRYSSTIKFLQELEIKCLNQLNLPVQRIRSSKSYKYFVKKWPISIYFQIRFQEIVFKFEQNLYFQQLPTIDDFFHLKVTNSLYESLNYCWNETCFLNSLTSNFWKLNLQLLARYDSFYKTAVFELINTTSTELNDQSPSIQLSQPQVTLQQQQPSNEADLKLLMYLMVDVKKLCDRLPNFFDGNVAPLMRASGVKEIAFVKGRFMIDFYLRKFIYFFIRIFIDFNWKITRISISDK